MAAYIGDSDFINNVVNYEEQLTRANEWITCKLLADVKPSKELAKQLDRIAGHKRQLLDAYSSLFAIYKRATTSQKRHKIAERAHQAMFDLMDDAMLRKFAASIIGETKAYDYVLPDDRAILYQDLASAMADKAAMDTKVADSQSEV